MSENALGVDQMGQRRTDRVAIDTVTHGFDGSIVLDELSLAVEPGEILAIIGPSGAGKTTLLRLLGLFDRPDDGTVRLDGTDVWAGAGRDRLAARRRIGMVFQEANLFDASVRRNVAYGLQVRRSWIERIRNAVGRFGRTASEDGGSVEDALDLVGLAGATDRSADSLSGGEAQRVAFARAIAYDPDYLLLDEPSSELDPRNTALIEDATTAARDRGLGVALATHDMHQARRIADRVAVLLDGSIIEVGPTDRVFSAPDDPRTRKFVDGELVY